MDYHGLSWTIIDYHGLSWTIMDYQELSWTIIDYHGLSWTVNTSVVGLQKGFNKLLGFQQNYQIFVSYN